MNHITVIAICCGVAAYALLSRRMQGFSITLPVFFTGFGLLLGNMGFGLIDMNTDSEVLAVFAEVTLVLVLFTDASQVRLVELRESLKIPVRMLLIGMPLTILFGSLVAQWASPEAPFAVALLVAAILTPTDAALGQSILSSKNVPLRIRQSINVESGLNDGLAVPVVILAAILSAQATGTEFHDAPENLFTFVLLQLTLGPIVGIGVGFVLGKLIDRSIESKLADRGAEAIVILAGALLSFSLAEAVGGNGFIAAFLGGLALGNSMRSSHEFSTEFMESEGKILTMVTFVVFGALLVPAGLEHANWRSVTVACLFLTVVRMLPVWLSLWGTDLPFTHKLTLGWFGPRGLASILFALLIEERFNIPGFEEVLACVVMTVLLSMVLHGASAAPIASRFKSAP